MKIQNTIKTTLFQHLYICRMVNKFDKIYTQIFVGIGKQRDNGSYADD